MHVFVDGEADLAQFVLTDVYVSYQYLLFVIYSVLVVCLYTVLNLALCTCMWVVLVASTNKCRY